MTLKNIALTLTILLLNACATVPSHLIVAPEILVPINFQYENKTASLQVMDLRTNKYIVSIAKKNEASTLLSPEKSLANIINKLMSEQWQKQGLEIIATTEQPTNAIEITIESAVIHVTQKMAKYSTERKIVIVVKVNNGEKTFTTTFSNTGQTTGVFKADIAVLERNFNLHLSNVLQQILTNKDVQIAIK